MMGCSTTPGRNLLLANFDKGSNEVARRALPESTAFPVLTGPAVKHASSDSWTDASTAPGSTYGRPRCHAQFPGRLFQFFDPAAETPATLSATARHDNIGEIEGGGCSVNPNIVTCRRYPVEATSSQGFVSKDEDAYHILLVYFAVSIATNYRRKISSCVLKALRNHG